MNPRKFYGMLSVFAFVLAGLGYLFHVVLTTAGYLTLNAANNMANVYSYVDKLEAQKVFDIYYDYQAEFYGAFLDWTVGSFNNVAGYLAILFAVCGLVFGGMAFRAK